MSSKDEKEEYVDVPVTRDRAVSRYQSIDFTDGVDSANVQLLKDFDNDSDTFFQEIEKNLKSLRKLKVEVGNVPQSLDSIIYICFELLDTNNKNVISLRKYLMKFFDGLDANELTKLTLQIKSLYVDSKTANKIYEIDKKDIQEVQDDSLVFPESSLKNLQGNIHQRFLLVNDSCVEFRNYLRNLKNKKKLPMDVDDVIEGHIETISVSFSNFVIYCRNQILLFLKLCLGKGGRILLHSRRTFEQIDYAELSHLGGQYQLTKNKDDDDFQVDDEDIRSSQDWLDVEEFTFEELRSFNRNSEKFMDRVLDDSELRKYKISDNRYQGRRSYAEILLKSHKNKVRLLNNYLNNFFEFKDKRTLSLPNLPDHLKPQGERFYYKSHMKSLESEMAEFEYKIRTNFDIFHEQMINVVKKSKKENKSPSPKTLMRLKRHIPNMQGSFCNYVIHHRHMVLKYLKLIFPNQFDNIEEVGGMRNNS